MRSSGVSGAQVCSHVLHTPSTQSFLCRIRKPDAHPTVGVLFITDLCPFLCMLQQQCTISVAVVDYSGRTISVLLTGWPCEQTWRRSVSGLLNRASLDIAQCGPLCSLDTIFNAGRLQDQRRPKQYTLIRFQRQFLRALQVRWHRSLESVQKGPPTIYIAHEFFDALPVHQFQRTERGWRECLVDVAAPPEDPHPLRLVLAPNDTPASRLLLQRRMQALPPELREAPLITAAFPVLQLCSPYTFHSFRHSRLLRMWIIYAKFARVKVLLICADGH